LPAVDVWSVTLDAPFDALAIARDRNAFVAMPLEFLWIEAT
jgi:hypothetical protein